MARDVYVLRFPEEKFDLRGAWELFWRLDDLYRLATHAYRVGRPEAAESGVPVSGASVASPVVRRLRKRSPLVIALANSPGVLTTEALGVFVFFLKHADTIVYRLGRATAEFGRGRDEAKYERAQLAQEIAKKLPGIGAIAGGVVVRPDPPDHSPVVRTL